MLLGYIHQVTDRLILNKLFHIVSGIRIETGKKQNRHYFRLVPGADPGFFLEGGAPLRNGVTD